MERGRVRGRATKKRGSLPSHSHSVDSQSSATPSSLHSPSDLIHPDSPNPSTPLPSAAVASGLPFAQRAPNTAPVRGGKSRPSHPTHNGQRTTSPTSDSSFRTTPRTEKPARSATFTTSLPFDSPSGAGNAMAGVGHPTRKRARTFEMSLDGTPDDEGHSKGGHSLRKRAKIDYAQEQIDDDLLATAAKSAVGARSAGTPSARGRKKKRSHDVPDDGSEHFSPLTGTQRRRRADKSPAATRGGLSRRRTQSKISTHIDTFHVDQPSDEVQDTILVGLPMNGLVEGSEESLSDQSFSESESRPSTSDGSDGAQAQPEPEPTTPQPQVLPLVEQAVSLASEGEVPIDKDLLDESTVETTHLSPTKVSLPLRSTEPGHPDDSHKAEPNQPEATHSDAAKIPPTQDLESAQESGTNTNPPKTEPVAELALSVQTPTPDTKSAPEQQNSIIPPTSEVLAQTQSARKEDNLENDKKLSSLSRVADTTSPAPSKPPTTVLPGSQDSADATTTPPAPLGQTTRSTQLVRLRELERVYRIPTPFGSELGLTPYEKEDVLHPGPFTEWVHPDKMMKSDVLTPALTPSPVDAASTDLLWDGRRPLNLGQLGKLYHQEWKRLGSKPQLSMREFFNECVKKYNSYMKQTALDSPADGGSTGSAQTEQQATRPGARPDPVTAPSPPPMDEDEPAGEPDGDGEDEPDAEEVYGRPKTVTTGEPIETTRNPSKQWSFPKVRDPQEITDILENHQSMDDTALYKVCAAATEALAVIEKEWHELRKITDDEETAKRRLANDKAVVNWERRQKSDEPSPWRRHFDEPIKGPPTFEVRGARAVKPYVDDPILEHQKEQDKIMANAYGFKYNPHPLLVGRQNPEEQRWETADNRLRERKKTEKGAELTEQNVVDGKRIRKPRYLSDQSKEPSRSGTPVGTVSTGTGRRGGRRKGFGGLNGDDGDAPENAEASTSAPEPVVRRRRGGFRGGFRGGRQPNATEEAPSNSQAGNQSDDDSEHEQQPAAQPPAPAQAENDKRQSNAKGQQAEIAGSSFYSNRSVDSHQESRPSTASSAATVNTEETTESLYSLREKRKRNFALENDPSLEPRPGKRATRGVVLPKFEGLEPKKRNPRKPATTSEPTSLVPPPAAPIQPAVAPAPVAPPIIAPQPGGILQAPTLVYGHPPPALAPAPAPFMHTFNAALSFPQGGNPPPPAAPPAVKKPITKIKLTNHGASSQASSRASTPANIAPNPKGTGKGSRGGKQDPGQGRAAVSAASLDDKPYAEMSKSEKMSWSMRRRWASGEMQGAVEKRRNTLASKKAEKAAGGLMNGSGASTPTLDPNSAGGTPVPVPPPPMAVSGLAMPGQTQTIPLQPHGLVPPQGMAGYGYAPLAEGPAPGPAQ
ncbi:hypothetical protein QBC47DRAFT_389200 [Echria macrotheca]|uniref:Uncharacterized protein n=1 Tax=Echria macrotheca TaxID=438768 RepID=A0AAJ0B8K3_9PEZI|nr:hypothetical protein QBC47DRAFT_389200 [Echria macrotheca]